MLFNQTQSRQLPEFVGAAGELSVEIDVAPADSGPAVILALQGVLPFPEWCGSSWDSIEDAFEEIGQLWRFPLVLVLGNYDQMLRRQVHPALELVLRFGELERALLVGWGSVPGPPRRRLVPVAVVMSNIDLDEVGIVEVDGGRVVIRPPVTVARQRYRLNDGQLRARINEGDDFRYIGQDSARPPEVRARFDLTRSEILRLQERGIPYETVSPEEVAKILGQSP